MRDNSKYVPGVCNIDGEGRRRRAVFGIIVIVISVVLWVFLRMLRVSLWQLLVVIPLWLGFNGIWQSTFSFCVGNASRHQFEIGGKVVKITDQKYIAKDKTTALRINLYSAASAAVLTIVLYVISILLK